MRLHCVQTAPPGTTRLVYFVSDLKLKYFGYTKSKVRGTLIPSALFAMLTSLLRACDLHLLMLLLLVCRRHQEPASLAYSPMLSHPASIDRSLEYGWPEGIDPYQNSISLYLPVCFCLPSSGNFLALQPSSSPIMVSIWRAGIPLLSPTLPVLDLFRLTLGGSRQCWT